MKILNLLLCICILVLSCLTCEDVTELRVNEQVKFSINSLNKNQNHANTDSCSPLCTCNCCGQPLVFSLKFTEIKDFKSALNNRSVSVYKQNFISGFYQNIWQPPKLNMGVIG